MGNPSIVLGTNSSINRMNTLTSFLFCNERYNAYTNSKFTRFTKFTVLCSLYESLTANDKIHNRNLLFKYCIRRLMVLKEVDFMALYMCVSIVREKYIHYSLFTNVRKVQHCTGYPLIQVDIVSACKSHYVCWLASQSSLLTSLFFECVVIF